MLSDINISHRRVVTLLRCGGICNDVFIANFLLSVTMKELENRSLFGEVMDKSLVSCFLLDHGVEIATANKVGHGLQPKSNRLVIGLRPAPLKFSSESVRDVLSNLADTQTNRHTNRQR